METTLIADTVAALTRTAAQGCVSLAVVLTLCWLAAAGFRLRGGESEAV